MTTGISRNDTVLYMALCMDTRISKGGRFSEQELIDEILTEVREELKDVLEVTLQKWAKVAWLLYGWVNGLFTYDELEGNQRWIEELTPLWMEME